MIAGRKIDEREMSTGVHIDEWIEGKIDERTMLARRKIDAGTMSAGRKIDAGKKHKGE